MKVAIIEPHLLDYTGHYQAFVSELKRGFEELGDLVELFLPRNSTASIAGKRVLPPKKTTQNRPLKAYLNLILDIFRFRAVLRKIEREFDLFVFASADDPALIGGAGLLNTKKPLIFYFHALESFLFPMRKSIKLFLAFNWLKKKRIALISPGSIEKEPIQNLLKGISLFGEAPFPLLPLSRPKEGGKCDDFFLSYLGDSRKEKNFHRLVQLIEFSPENIGFIVQCNPPNPGGYEPEIKEAVERVREIRNDRLLIFEGPLPDEQYHRLLNLSSIVWCLYDSLYYQNRISGILLEAWALGKPVITTARTWMARQVHRFGGGITLDSPAVENILDAIEQIKVEYPRFAQEAESAGVEFCQRNNGPALARFIKESLEKVQ